MTDDQTTPNAEEFQANLNELAGKLQATPNADEWLIANSEAVEKVLTGIRELLHKIG